MSNAPYIMRGARWGYRMGNGELIDSCSRGAHLQIKGCHMGNTAEEIVNRFTCPWRPGLLCRRSQRRAEQAINAERLSIEMCGRDRTEERARVRMEKDEYPRAGPR